jgi:ATP-dependent DNA helicase DinG
MRQLETLCKDVIEAEVAEAADSKQLDLPSDRLNRSAAEFRISIGQFPEKSEWARIQYAPPIQKALGELQLSISDLLEILETLASRGKELASCYRRLETIDLQLKLFLEAGDKQVSWYEWSERNFRLILSPVEVSDAFRQKLDASSCSSVFFTSATLSTQQSFRYYGQRLGIEDIPAQSFESPFNYQEQALLYIPDFLPDPSDPQYAKAFGELCCELILACQGYCFILFTSYRMLSWTADYLRSRLKNPLFVQGDLQRSELLAQYLQASNPVLLGTNSFWEGVDVKGDRLRCVIIDKLPFKSPQDPVYKKRLQLANQAGGNAFMEVQIPEATISLRQGVGRLIRDINDRGIVMLCDNRLNSKSYGRNLIESLPPMKRGKDLAEVKQFAQNTFG